MSGFKKSFKIKRIKIKDLTIRQFIEYASRLKEFAKDYNVSTFIKQFGNCEAEVTSDETKE